MKSTLRRHFQQIAIQQGKIESPLAAKRPAVRHRDVLHNIVSDNQLREGDAAKMMDGKLVLLMPDAVLANNNTLLRVGDLVASAYKNSWVQRLHDIRLLHLNLWREWRHQVAYPVLIEAVYCVPHTNMMDRDGLTASLKYPIDALRKSGFITDDDPRCVAQVLPTQIPASQQLLCMQIRPAPSAHGLVDQGLISQVYDLLTENGDNSVDKTKNPPEKNKV